MHADNVLCCWAWLHHIPPPHGTSQGVDLKLVLTQVLPGYYYYSLYGKIMHKKTHNRIKYVTELIQVYRQLEQSGRLFSFRFTNREAWITVCSAPLPLCYGVESRVCRCLKCLIEEPWFFQGFRFSLWQIHLKSIPRKAGKGLSLKLSCKAAIEGSGSGLTIETVAFASYLNVCFGHPWLPLARGMTNFLMGSFKEHLGYNLFPVRQQCTLSRRIKPESSGTLKTNKNVF